MPRLKLIAALAVAAAVVALVPLAATGGTDDRLFVGFSLHFTGPMTTAGTFVMSGEVEDSGASAVDHLALVTIAGAPTRRGCRGTRRTSDRRGRSSPTSTGTRSRCRARTPWARAASTSSGGTGAYAGIDGNAT